MFNVMIGEKGLRSTYQEKFPKTTGCVHCDNEAQIGFVATESWSRKEPPKKGELVCHLHENDPGGEGFWLHDCCAVAVYFCKKCLEPTALYNQG